MEDKTLICEALLPVLRMTRAGSDIERLGFIPDHPENGGYHGDIVRIYYKNGGTRDVGVDCDSGIAMIYDIVNKVRS